jgi:hypothetical protein
VTVGGTATVEQTEEAMPDQREIQQLFSLYAAAIDYQQFHLLEDVFTEGACWQCIEPNSEGVIIEGRSAIREFLPICRAEGQTRHVMSNFRVLRGDERSARAEMSLTFIVSHGHVFNVETSGVYRAEAVLDASGWRFRELTLTIDFAR